MSPIIKKIILLSLLQAAFTFAERPNIIVLMADDLGYNDLGVYGGKDIPTPHLDQLANEGVRFTSGYVTWPMCGPSRAGFLTGRHQSTFGYYENVSAPFDSRQGLPQMDTIGSLLQEQGYVTGGVGKWHMGTTDEQHPNALGFDDWFGFLGGGLMYYPLDHPSYEGRFTPIKRPLHMKYLQHTLPLIHNRKPVQWNQYLTRELTDAGVAFLERNHEKPFFLFMSYNAPHLDLEAPEETIAKFPPENMSKVPGVTPKSRSVYGAMVSEMDQGIGKILANVSALGLDDNTLIWFLSDNGGMKKTSDNRPLRGAKGSPYEGGIRVPMFVKWQGKTTAGKVLHSPMTSLDLTATTIAIAGGNPEEKGLHGKNIWPHIMGQSTEAPHERLYWHTARNTESAGVIREGDFKLIINKKKLELYNLKNDLNETNNLAALHPKKAKTLHRIWLEWDKAKAPPLWKGGRNIQYAHYDWLIGSPHYRPADQTKAE